MVLSVDPGLSNYGYAVWNEYGEICDTGLLQTKKTKRKNILVADDMVHRMARLTVDLEWVIRAFKIKAVIGERPGFASQNSAAMRDMSASMAVSVAVFTMLNLSMEWATPEEVKVAFTGKKTASKKEMMIKVCKRHSWNITTKRVNFKNSKQLKRLDNIYHPMGVPMGANKFEHIADAVAAAHALKNGNIIKMYLNKRR
jgi:Holliday junction resolvasome RuvABC endonuclease subunit